MGKPEAPPRFKMNVAVIGAHGQIGQLLVPKLLAGGMDVRAMVRGEEQREALGATAILGDLEGDFEHVLEGCDAVVFTAGSGGHTGGDMTLRIDLWGAVRSYAVCAQHGVRRYLMVSAIGAQDPPPGRERIKHYLVAKHIADDYLQRSGLDFTIVRPGKLLNEPGTGHIATGPELLEQGGSIPREDVADTIVACLRDDSSIGKAFNLVSGATPIADAIAGLP